MEQQVAPVLVVSHLSVLQLLIAYMRNSPVEKAMSIDVPLHTVLKFVPSRGGGWSESRHKLIQDEDDEDVAAPPPHIETSKLKHSSTNSLVTPATPIWEDPVSRKSLSPKEAS